MARDPVSGRIRRRASLNVALRAALLAELAFAGQIRNQLDAPAVALAEPTGDRLLDAVRAAVEHRPDVMWMRWFRHVRVDLPALRKDLLDDGRWQRRPGMRASYTDDQQDALLALAAELDQIARYERAPADERQTVLATLAVICGATGQRPRPRAVRQDLAPLVVTIPNETVQHILKIAAATASHARMGRSAT